MRQKLHFFELNPSDLVANVTRELATDPQHVPLGLAASRGPTIPDPLSQIASSEIGIPGTELRFAIQGTDLGQRAPNASIDIGSSSGVFATRNSESQDWAMALSIVNTVAVKVAGCIENTVSITVPLGNIVTIHVGIKIRHTITVAIDTIIVGFSSIGIYIKPVSNTVAISIICIVITV